MSEAYDVEETKNPKRLLLDMLRILTYFYSFRQLEKKLGFPMQTLWKYHTLRTVPEKETAIKILKRIQESRIVEEIISELAHSVSDVYELLSNIGILELASFDAIELVKQYKINTAISAPHTYSAALAALISSKIRVSMCITDRLYTTSNSVCTAIRAENNICIPLCVKRECISRKARIMFVKSKHVKGSIREVNNFLNKHGTRVHVMYIIYGDKEQINDEIEHIHGEKLIVKILIGSISKKSSRS